jgi:AmmeMemoRadiSam system protein B
MLSISADQQWFDRPNTMSLTEYVTDSLKKNHPGFIRTTQFRGIITPHDSIAYSGDVSATMYNCLLENARSSRFKNIIFLILCANHHYNSNNLILPSNVRTVEFNRTKIPVNNEIIDLMYQVGTDIEFNNQAIKEEHSFFNQLPFISHIVNQLSSKTVSILPIVVGTYNISSNLAKVLGRVLNRQNVFTIISTDFNHVGPQFSSQLPSSIQLKKMDLNALDYLYNRKYTELLTQYSVCGAKALILYDILHKLVSTDLQLLIRRTSYNPSQTNKKDLINWGYQDGIVSYLGLVIT